MDENIKLEIKPKEYYGEPPGLGQDTSLIIDCTLEHIPLQDPAVQSTHNDTKVRRHGIKKIPSQIYCPDGIIFRGKIIHIESPSEFYVLPENGWHCICNKPTPGYVDSALGKRKLFIPSFDGYNNFIQKITDIVLSDLSAYKKTSFDKHELVACRIDNGKKQEWHRGMIIENYSMVNDKTNVGVQIQLIDYGKRLKLPIERVVILPENCSLKYPPFTYKCTLFGVIPIGPIWTKLSKEYFKCIVKDTVVLVEVKRPMFPEKDKNIFNGTPYQVRITLPGKKDDENDTGRQLVTNGFAIELNRFPYRPDIMRQNYKNMTSAIVELLDPFPNVGHKIPKNILDKEIERLDKKLTSMDIKIKGKNLKIIQIISNPNLVQQPTNKLFLDMITK